MLDQLKKLVSMLSAKDRRNGIILLVMMVTGAALEVIGVAAVPAFVSAVVYPDKLAQFPIIYNMIQTLGLGETADLVVWGAAALVTVFAIKNGYLVLNYWVQMRYVTNRRMELSQRLTRAYMQAPFTFHVTRNTSELLRNIDRESSIIAYQVIGAILELLTHILILVAVLVFLFIAEPWITFWWMLIFGAIGSVAVFSVSAKLKRYGLKEQEERKGFVQSLYQGFGSIKEARVLNREYFFARKINQSVDSMANVLRFKQFVQKAVGPVTEFTAIAGLLVIAAALVLLERPTESVLVTLSLFVVALVRLRQTIGAAMTHLTALRYSIVSVDPVYADLKMLEGKGQSWQELPPSKLSPPRRLEKAIEMEDIWYRHGDAPDYALKGINLSIPAGSAVGFVGSTGAGKSTLVDIILGLLKPERGVVRVDGTDIRRDIGAWQRSIGYVPQSISLLDDTIRRNIALGLDDAEIDEDALQAAVRLAQLESFVARQPKGLDEIIGEQGARLSGGERQRIGIARALYHDPEVLILDEATSALDNATERAIIAAVEALKGRRTIIMIAHRLTTVRNCDTLYFLKAGSVDAAGNFDELEDRHADFRLMSSG